MQYLYLGVLRHVFGVRFAVSVLVNTSPPCGGGGGVNSQTVKQPKNQVHVLLGWIWRQKSRLCVLEGEKVFWVDVPILMGWRGGVAKQPCANLALTDPKSIS